MTPADLAILSLKEAVDEIHVLRAENERLNDLSRKLAQALAEIIGRQYVKQCDDEFIPLMQQAGAWLDEEQAE